MTDLFAQLLDQYDRFRGEIGRIEETEALARAQKLLDDIKEAGKVIANPDERGVLSDLAYDLGGIIFDYSGFYPSVRLVPLAAGEVARQRLEQTVEEAREVEDLEALYVMGNGRLGEERWEDAVESFRRWVARTLRDPVSQGIGVLVAIVALIVAVYPFAMHAIVNPATPTPKPLILCNGTFDDKFECWEHGGELKQSVKCDGDQCYAVLGSPEYKCEGDVPIGEAWIKQSFQVPQMVSPTLSLRYRVFSYDLDIVDFFQVQINDSPVAKIGNPLWNAPSCDLEPWDSGWRTFEFDLSPYKGQSVEVLLSNVNETHEWYNTWTQVDDVQVR